MTSVIRQRSDHAHDPKNPKAFLCSAAQSEIWGKRRKQKMKKIMFTAAVAAAGLAFGIESANIVG